MRTALFVLAAFVLIAPCVTGCGGNGPVSIDRTDEGSGSTNGRRAGSGQSANRTSAGAESPPSPPSSGQTPAVAAADRSGDEGDSGRSPSNDRQEPDSGSRQKSPGFPKFVRKPPPTPRITKVDLQSGKQVDVNVFLKEEKAAFEERLEERLEGSRIIRIDYSGDSAARLTVEKGYDAGHPQPPPNVLTGDKPFLYVSQFRGRMRGPTAAYYENGVPMFYINYDRDSRPDGTVIAWDQYERPVVLAQYDGGRLNGLRILFQPESAYSPVVSVCVVEEWRSGSRRASHLIVEGKVVTIGPNEEAGRSGYAEQLAEAARKLDDFDNTLASNKRELGKAVVALHRNGARSSQARRNTAGSPSNAAEARARVLSDLRAAFRLPTTDDHRRSDRRRPASGTP